MGVEFFQAIMALTLCGALCPYAFAIPLEMSFVLTHVGTWVGAPVYMRVPIEVLYCQQR